MIRAYAAAYLQEYAGADFSKQPEKYDAWYRQFGEMQPDVLVRLAQSSSR
jgi:hypothetical protein